MVMGPRHDATYLVSTRDPTFAIRLFARHKLSPNVGQLADQGRLLRVDASHHGANCQDLHQGTPHIVLAFRVSRWCKELEGGFYGSIGYW